MQLLFSNHSCAPNLVVFPGRSHSVVPRLCLFAKRNVVAGEELTYHYGQSGGLRQGSPAIVARITVLEYSFAVADNITLLDVTFSTWVNPLLPSLFTCYAGQLLDYITNVRGFRTSTTTRPLRSTPTHVAQVLGATAKGLAARLVGSTPKVHPKTALKQYIRFLNL